MKGTQSKVKWGGGGNGGPWCEWGVMVHIKEKGSPCSDGSGFPLSLSECSFTVNKMC